LANTVAARVGRAVVNHNTAIFALVICSRAIAEVVVYQITAGSMCTRVGLAIVNVLRAINTEESSSIAVAGIREQPIDASSVVEARIRNAVVWVNENLAEITIPSKVTSTSFDGITLSMTTAGRRE